MVGLPLGKHASIRGARRALIDLPGDLRAAMRSAARALIYSVPCESERCPACQSRQLYELDLLPLRPPVHGYRTGFVSGCDDCGLVFSNPQPTRAEQDRFYSPEGEWGSRRSGAPPVVEEREDKRGTSWSWPFEAIRDELSVTAPPPGAKVLDFGCADGKLLDALQDSGWETWGIESASDAAFARHRRLEAIPTSPTFDLIVANHVFEHVTDPLGLLRELAAACRVGGYLHVGVPRFDTLPIHRDYKYVINGRAHVTAYTWPCLQGLLARAGWEPVAPPADRLPKGQGRYTYARLRVLARRVAGPVEAMAAPAHAARAAVRRYHADTHGRSLFERLGWFRLAARRAEAQRRAAIRIRKSKKWGRRSFFEDTRSKS
jgi:SAM-dependent methyltransferase